LHPAQVTAPAAAGDAIFVGTTAGEVWRPKSGEVAQRWTVGGPVRSLGSMLAPKTAAWSTSKNPEFTGWAT
jgi:hypothetical protein